MKNTKTKVWETIHILANQNVDTTTMPGYIIVDAYNYNPYTLETWKHNGTNIMIHPSQNEKGIGGPLAGYMDSKVLAGKRALIINNTKEIDPPVTWDQRFRHHVERVDEDRLYQVVIYIFASGKAFVNNRMNYHNDFGKRATDWSIGESVDYEPLQGDTIVAKKVFAENLPNQLAGIEAQKKAIELCKNAGLTIANDPVSLKAKETIAWNSIKLEYSA